MENKIQNIIGKELKKPKITPKKMKQIHKWVRALIQLGFFLYAPSIYSASFNGVKYIFTSLGAGSRIECTTFVSLLITICIYTILFGRFFCGYACAFGSLGDAVRALYVYICKKRKKKPITLSAKITSVLSYMKYVVLAVIVVACYKGVYSKAQGTSPWDVFSMIYARNTKFITYKIGLVLLVLIIIGMAVQERFFCRFFCPMGAVFSMLPVVPFFSLHRDRENCIKGCSACTRMCPMDIELPAKGSIAVSGDCIQCQKCIDTCPKKNVATGTEVLKGNEIIFTIIRAAILVGLFHWLGV